MRVKRVPKIFWAWNVEKEEEWLRQMSLQGWQLDSYTFLYYKFRKIESCDYIYKIDYKNTFNNDFEEYVKIFEDAGWEYVMSFLGYKYFRIKKELCEYPDIYSDTTSKIQRFKDILRVMIAVSFLQIPNIINVVRFYIIEGYSRYRVFLYLQVACLFLLAFAIIRILMKINELKNSSTDVN